jgi:hypothetical protein
MVTLIVFSSLGIGARANSVQNFDVKQGTALVTASAVVIGNLEFNFSGSNFSMNGFGTVDGACGFCVYFAPPGFGPLSGSNTITNSGPDIGSVTLGGVSYDNVLFHGLVTIISSKMFSLPLGNQSSFTITLPVAFSGQLMACPVNSDFNGCASPDLATFNFQHLNGKVKIDFLNNGDNTYSFDKALYTITPVPEPATMALVGLGTFLLLLRGRKRISDSSYRA